MKQRGQAGSLVPDQTSQPTVINGSRTIPLTDATGQGCASIGRMAEPESVPQRDCHTSSRRSAGGCLTSASAVPDTKAATRSLAPKSGRCQWRTGRPANLPASSLLSEPFCGVTNNPPPNPVGILLTMVFFFFFFALEHKKQKDPCQQGSVNANPYSL